MKPAVQKVQAAITEHGLDRRVIELEVHARTSQQAADALGVAVGQIVKSLVFTADGRPLLVAASGANRVDERRLAELAGGRIRRADPDTVKTSDFTIWPTATPSASAACCEVRAWTSSSITRRSRPCSVMAACTFWTAGFIAPRAPARPSARAPPPAPHRRSAW